MKIQLIRTGALVGLIACGPALWGGCKKDGEEDMTEELLLVGLAAAFTPTNPGSCSFTFGSRTVPIQEYSLPAAGTFTYTNGFTGLFKQWGAVKVTNVVNGTVLAYNYNPWYSSGGKEYYLVYNESGCPITNNSNADFNYTFPDLATARTPTNYSVSGNTLTFNATGATKNFVIVSAASSTSGSEKITRTN